MPKEDENLDYPPLNKFIADWPLISEKLALGESI
jgi:hypothetical protein